MKVNRLLPLFAAFVLSQVVLAQDQDRINTIFKSNSLRHSGGYGAIVNKFTVIDGQFANMAEVYGGWYINHRYLIGVGAGATTNYIRVPLAYSTLPTERMSYEVGQVGLVQEYVIASNRAVHANVHVFTGAGFSMQYVRYDWRQVNEPYNFPDYDHDSNWFFVVEPGVNLEINVFQWMRLSPGVSYRFANGSTSQGLTDKKISGGAVNLALKFGRF